MHRTKPASLKNNISLAILAATVMYVQAIYLSNAPPVVSTIIGLILMGIIVLIGIRILSEPVLKKKWIFIALAFVVILIGFILVRYQIMISSSGIPRMY
mgnify:CR=1 FL=1